MFAPDIFIISCVHSNDQSMTIIGELFQKLDDGIVHYPGSGSFSDLAPLAEEEKD